MTEQRIEQIKDKLYGKTTGDTICLVIEADGQQDSPRIIEIVVLEDDGDTVVYRYSDDNFADGWAIGSIEDVIAYSGIFG